MVREGKLCLLSLLQFIYILISFPRPALESTSESKTNILKMKSRPLSAFLWKLLEKPGMGHFLWPTGQPVSPYPSTSSGQFCKGFSQHQQTSCLFSSLSTPWEEVLPLNIANREMLPPFPPSSLPLIDPKCYLSQSLPEIIRIHLEYTSLLAILEGEVIVFGGIKGVTVSVAC